MEGVSAVRTHFLRPWETEETELYISKNLGWRLTLAAECIFMLLSLPFFEGWEGGHSRDVWPLSWQILAADGPILSRLLAIHSIWWDLLGALSSPRIIPAVSTAKATYCFSQLRKAAASSAEGRLWPLWEGSLPYKVWGIWQNKSDRWVGVHGGPPLESLEIWMKAKLWLKVNGLWPGIVSSTIYFLFIKKSCFLACICKSTYQRQHRCFSLIFSDSSQNQQAKCHKCFYC